MEEYLGFLFLVIILGIITGIMGEWIAKKKGRREREGFWLGFLLSFIGLIIEGVLPKLSKPDPVTQSSGIDGRVFDASASDGRSRRKCPFCAEMILAEARVCRYCQRDVPQSPAKERSSLFASSSSELNSRQTEQVTQAPAQTEQVTQAPAQTEQMAQAPAQTEQMAQAPAQLEQMAQAPAQLEQVVQVPTQTEQVAQAPAQTEQMTQAPAQLTCPSCARMISANDRFCFFCGKKLRA
jgi:uncharacterized membrane protein YeaQ/YmgE (transglycosylase-associated protein family)